MRYAADLHIHSCLSPCGDLSMSPALIARKAAFLGLAVAALTDHNSALNAPAFAAACAKEGIVPVFGIEVTTREELHVLALFERPEEALELGKDLYELLPAIRNDPAKFGDQVYVDEEEAILGEVEKYLVNAVDLSLDDVAARILSAGGLFIPAHVDRPIFSISSQLGFLPDMPYSAIEVTEWPCLMNPGSVPMISSSDAHYPDAIGKRFIRFEASSPSFASLRDALREGRVSPSITKE